MNRVFLVMICVSSLFSGCVESVAVNNVPVSFAGFDRTVSVVLNQTDVDLDGTGSYDPDSDLLNYRWRVESTPPDSKISEVNNYDSPIGTFIPDAEGEYVFSLVVDDGVFVARKDIVVITVISK